jgi:hypothetical protein
MFKHNFGEIADRLVKDMADIGPRLDSAGLRAAKIGAQTTRDVLRQQVAASGMPPKMQKTVRDRVYKKNKQSGRYEGRDAAGFVWSAAPMIMQAATDGGDIQPQGRYLILPTEDAIGINLHRQKRVREAGESKSGKRQAVWKNAVNLEEAKKRFTLLFEKTSKGYTVFAVDAVRKGKRIRRALFEEVDGVKHYKEEPQKIALFFMVPRVRWKKSVYPEKAIEAGVSEMYNALDQGLK